MTRLCIGIPTINCADLLLVCLRGLQDLASAENLEWWMVIVDNGHQKLEYPATLNPRITTLINNENKGVAGSWNQICRLGFGAGADNVMLLNDDVVYTPVPEALIALCLENPGITTAEGGHQGGFQNALISRRAWETIGPFDEIFFPAYFEDCDYGYRANLLDIPMESSPDLAVEKQGRNSNSRRRDPSLNRGLTLGAVYQKKWGGEPHKEIFTEPYNGEAK